MVSGLTINLNAPQTNTTSVSDNFGGDSAPKKEKTSEAGFEPENVIILKQPA